MKDIDGSLPISYISMPITHDTMAIGDADCSLQGIFNHAHDQAWSLRTQLDAGVRGIDARLKYHEGYNILHHSVNVSSQSLKAI
jgi:hypothetical protein